MKKCLVFGLLLVVELYGVALLGYFYSISLNTTILTILIISVVIMFLTSALCVKMFYEPTRVEKRKVIEKWKKCPYFIDKYDYVENPEYIDKEIL